MLWNGRDFEGWTFYLNPPKSGEAVDPMNVWSIRDGAIHCLGAPNGYMRTLADYTNYKLHVEWRWVPDPERAKGRNSGVLLHMSEPEAIWPKSIEAQLMAGNAGDFFVIGGTTVKELDPGPEGKNRRVAKMGESAEKEIGEWNEYDILCKGDTIEVRVNGELKNRGTQASVQAGKICLQSEGAPIEFRNVYIEPAE
ncbi:MAG: hypothetical protein BWZ10_03275 [candidate division BRC1 bacterium ADurb.BinA364]|nr:MAG: hypothetical protein BWZ10_03275 [candidate division BRC1 bacterium ADurb.BinA364]